MKNKCFISVSIKFAICLVMFVFLCSCSSVSKLPKLSSDAENFRSEFLLNYGFFVNKDDMKEIQNCLTLQSLQDFSQKFWKIRDTNPNTPENEFKELIDERINDIKSEVFFHGAETGGIRLIGMADSKEIWRVFIFFMGCLRTKKEYMRAINMRS
jgi:hypothetical protein